MNKLIRAGDVKPNFNTVKKIWTEMLNSYYNKNGTLKGDVIITVDCPYCENNSYSNEFSISGFRHVTCECCKTVYVTPRLKDQWIDKLYSEEYYSEMYTTSMIPTFLKRKELIGKRKYKQTLQFLSKQRGTVLDIGCGIGEVIDVFKDNDWDCFAIEINPVAFDWLKSKGINVSNDHFDDYKSNVQFDVIMAWGVIEHVLNSKLFLKKVHSLLKPGGVFVSEIPHGNSLLVDYTRKTGIDPGRIVMGEQHIVLYSIDAYCGLHTEAGLKNLHIQTNGLDFSTIMETTNSSIDDTVTMNMQDIIDKKLFGDLLRGFWTKELK